uniref:hypothetical protein n=1 Tax=Alistipes shahii TaxID=328814 RepID=UPI004029C1EE
LTDTSITTILAPEMTYTPKITDFPPKSQINRVQVPGRRGSGPGRFGVLRFGVLYMIRVFLCFMSNFAPLIV